MEQEGVFVSIPKELIGEKVYHKTLKHGIIVDCLDSYILVKFDNESSKQEPHRFQFPNIMFNEQKLMTTDSSIVNDYISTYRANHTCSKCGKCVIEDLSLSSHHLCSNCVPKIVVCAECGKCFTQDKCIKDCYGETLCKECVKSTRFYCSCCKRLHPLSELIQSPFMPKELHICDSCIESDDYIQCTCCDTYVPKEIIEHIDGYMLCPKCKKLFTGQCSICGKLSFLGNSDTETICRECKRLILHQKFIDNLDFSKLKIESISFSTFKTSKTIKLMSRLRHSYGNVPQDEDKLPIDILLIETYYGNLVVCYDAPESSKMLYHHSCTLTTLKKDGVLFLFNENTCTVKRELPVPYLNKTFYVWERPYLLYAQTASDMDYGDHWEGSELVYEGNRYGNTSKFIILGFVR